MEQLPDFLSQLPQIALGGVPVAAVVLVVVQALKFGGMLRTEAETRLAVLITALAFSGLWLAGDLYPAAEPVISAVTTAIVGAAGSALAYTGLSRLTSRE